MGIMMKSSPPALSVLVGGNLQGQPMEQLSEGLVK